MGIIFHITQKKNWEKAQGVGNYHIQSLDTEGFIHCSRHYQICDVAKKGFVFPSEALKLTVESSATDSTGPGYNIPKHYDAMNGAQGSDVDFYVQMATAKGGSVLDLACGSGRFSIPIAQAGCTVTGLDISSAMLNRAREKAREQNLSIDFQLGDIRLFEINKKFYFIFCGFNSSQHLHEEKEFVSFLEIVKRHLASDGIFAFDVFNPSVKMLSRDPQQRYSVKQIFVCR